MQFIGAFAVLFAYVGVAVQAMPLNVAREGSEPSISIREAEVSDPLISISREVEVSGALISIQTRCSQKFLGARDFTNHAISLSLKFYNTVAGQREHSGLCSVQLPTLAAEEEYWSTLIANHAQTMGNQRMRLGQRKEAQRWTVIQWFNQADWTPYIQYELILV
ncbi:hypothetical protein B0H14DRAFT_3124607 [Mycena olivaceomarginata]|nr:hypothetical protein B0H14DRAFT_3124607 [Mycena olivaceomarginata]